MKRLILMLITILFAIFIKAQVPPGLHVAENKIVLFGEDTTGVGVKTFWMPFKAAFRTGAIGVVNVDNSGEPFFSDPNNWNPDSVGIFSFAAGFGTKAKGWYSVAMGEESEALGIHTFSFGNQSKAIGSTSVAMGDEAISLGQRSVALGGRTLAVGDYSVAVGRETIANGRASTVIGQYNFALDDPDLIADTARLFIIGNGSSLNNRSNAMVVQKSGRVGIGTNAPSELLDVNGNALIRSNLKTNGTSNLLGKLNLGPGTGVNELNIFDIGNSGDAIIRAQTTGGAKEMVLGVSPSGGLFGTVTSDILNLRTSNTTRMSITASGDVGIGTTGPGEKLDVNGSALIRTNLTTNGTSNLLGRLNIGPGTGSNELNIFDFGNSGDAIIRAQTTGGAKEMVLGVSPSGGLFGTVSNDILNFRTNNTTRMSITTTGDVGIGTTSPENKLEVNGNIQIDRGSSESGLTRTLKIQGARNTFGNEYARIDFRNIDNNDNNTEYVGARISSEHLQINTTQNIGSLAFWNQSVYGFGKRMELNQLGWLEIYTDAYFHNHVRPYSDGNQDLGSPSNRWDNIWATNVFIQTSDGREKTQIQDISYGLSDILDLRPVTYKWKNKTYEDPHLGLIAQEVQEIIPEVIVGKDYDIDPESGKVSIKNLERLGMRSTEIIPVLIKAIQEQQVMIENQANDIAELKVMVSDLRSNLLKD